MSEGAFYRVATAAGPGSVRYEDRVYEVIEAGTTASSQPAYNTTMGAETADGTAVLKAYDSFTRAAWIEVVRHLAEPAAPGQWRRHCRPSRS